MIVQPLSKLAFYVVSDDACNSDDAYLAMYILGCRALIYVHKRITFRSPVNQTGPGLGDAWSVDSLLENGRRMVLSPPSTVITTTAAAAAIASASADTGTLSGGAALVKIRATHASVYPKRYAGVPHAGDDSDRATVKVSPATFALLAQLAGCYFQTGYNKLWRKGGAEWDFKNLSAVHLSLAIHKWKKWPMADILLEADRSLSPRLQWLVDMIGGSAIPPANHPEAGIAVTQLLTAFTIVVELGTPLLLFWPFFPRRFLAPMRYVCRGLSVDGWGRGGGAFYTRNCAQLPVPPPPAAHTHTRARICIPPNSTFPGTDCYLYTSVQFQSSENCAFTQRRARLYCMSLN